MHKFVLGTFDVLKNCLRFVRIIVSFLVMMLALYWIQNIIHASWDWMGFVAPFFDGLLDVANSIYSISFNIFGAEFELKYLSAVIILVLLGFVSHLLIMGLDVLEGAYNTGYYLCKKTKEIAFNDDLRKEQEVKEKKINKYGVYIGISVRKNRLRPGEQIDLDEQNKKISKFILDNTGVVPYKHENGFIYEYANFENVDKVLDILYKMMNSNAPLNYVVCVQTLADKQKDIKQLKKLAELNNNNKICLAADTKYRYSFNNSHRYEARNVGIYQYDGRELEVFEFKELF